MAIKTILIDDNEDYLFDLKEHLEVIPDVEIKGVASNYKKAKQLFLQNTPDLVFLDIEMPIRNGFELLTEFRNESCSDFKVIFYTAYDQYIIEALRQSAFDYLVKPSKHEEIVQAIERYKNSVKQPAPIEMVNPFINQNMVALPVHTGLKFIEINTLVHAQFIKTGLFNKPNWICTLNNHQELRLRQNITASNLLSIFGRNHFIQISQSVLVNKTYIGCIEYKTRKCILIPPFNNIDLTISRMQLGQLREQFDRF
jgi:two-component system LytT family response regulator